MPGTSPHPVLLFDSELGPEGGLRPKAHADWQTFEMIRPIAVASEFRLSVAMTGQAEIQLDDLQIQKLPPVEPRNILQLTGEEVDRKENHTISVRKMPFQTVADLSWI